MDEASESVSFNVCEGCQYAFFKEILCARKTTVLIISERDENGLQN